MSCLSLSLIHISVMAMVRTLFFFPTILRMVLAMVRAAPVFSRMVPMMVPARITIPVSYTHLKRELDDELHNNDTVQEKLSLAARFGVTIYYGSPDKRQFETIVKALADRHGLDLSLIHI